jgi:flagellar basal-body rod protein FlgB
MPTFWYNDMSEFSSILIIKALDGLAARSIATAHNVANASTPGYRPVRVTFEQALLSASKSGTAALQDVEPGYVTATGPDPLRLDLELATASSTSLRYGALVEVLNRQMQLRAIATRGS